MVVAAYSCLTASTVNLGSLLAAAGVLATLHGFYLCPPRTVTTGEENVSFAPARPTAMPHLL